MSGFMSNRYLKFLEARQAQDRRPPFDHDRACLRCGYNLRGRRLGERCPECGTVIEQAGALHDELLAGSAAEQRRFRAALVIASACIVGAVAARLFKFIAGFDGLSDATRIAYVGLGLALSLLWAGAAWMLTPPRLASGHPRLGVVRRLVRTSQLLWPIAYTCWLLAVLRGADGLLVVGAVLRLVAWAGAIVFAWFLWCLAERAQRENAARRLNAAVWLLAPVALLPQVFPNSMPWYLLTPLGIFLFLWAWVMLLYAAGVFELERHVRWSMVHEAGVSAHAERVAQVRRAHERRTESRLRPLPPIPPDIPIAPPQEPS